MAQDESDHTETEQGAARRGPGLTVVWIVLLLGGALLASMAQREALPPIEAATSSPVRLFDGRPAATTRALTELGWKPAPLPSPTPEGEARQVFHKSGATLTLEPDGVYVFDWGDDGVAEPGLDWGRLEPTLEALLGEGATSALAESLPAPASRENRVIAMLLEDASLPAVMLVQAGRLRGLTVGDVEP